MNLKLFFGVFLALTFSAAADIKPLKFKIEGELPAGSRLLAVARSGESKTVDITSNKISFVPPAKVSSLYIIGPNQKLSHQIVNKFCSKAKKGKNKGRFTSCKKKNKVVTHFKAGTNLKTAKVKDHVLLTSLKNNAYTKAVNRKSVVPSTDYEPAGIRTKGLGSSSIASRKGLFGIKNVENDQDGDGLIDNLDIDDDGDGIIDNYDSDSSSEDKSTSFYVFSNLKLDIDSSINLHSTGLSPALTDEALKSAQTLAIEVVGEPTDTVELDCGTLSYCSAGGTGTTFEGNTPFPDGLDSDGDGLGTITKGTTNDFQLKTNATSGAIGAGDTFIQKVTRGELEGEVPGILNFVFHSTPAIKTVTVDGYPPVVVNYSDPQVAGSRGNCLPALASADVIVTVEAWRPQRPGIIEAGESEYVDIGNSHFTFDIPNGPCDNNLGINCNSPGVPELCPPSAYSTTDPNLTITNRKTLLDSKGDVNADSNNTFTFTVNVTQCLASAGITWNAGETLFIDLASGSLGGDNAAQKFCITKNL